MATRKRKAPTRICKTCSKSYSRSGFKHHCSAECRFWVNVRTGNPQECWPWRLRLSPKGYGKFKYRGEQLAHRVAYWLATGIPPGEAVRHKCDNPPCCNPNHLVSGTQLENIADRDAKGRTGDRPRGRDNVNAKLNEALVRMICADKRSHAELAREIGVAAHTIHAVRAGKTWSHVSGIKRPQSEKPRRRPP